ncbi:hypothetical protein IG193_07300 [Infirmifilum lucidum]|uniref:Uncharacterized protein n=1 Tax=Infirmifilum lucidum TaxID=2776706 RepID=A0A7L9FI14_9CREN|nr:hypothetical protein [Infirmifilum lucidum]QOJ78554.1 hypothetical protein IG193_07300 [Infirmifilum lucidum]
MAVNPISVRLLVNGEEVPIPVYNTCGIVVENREEHPARLRIEYRGGDWELGTVVLKVEFNGNTVYIGRSTREGASWGLTLQPGERVAINFTAVVPPRAGYSMPSIVRLGADIKPAVYAGERRHAQ